jgi:hypothetical protein
MPRHRSRAVAPPSTAMICPVMNALASDASSAATPFRSSGPPRRRSGAFFAASAPSVSIRPRVIFVGNNPGAIAFTLMPWRAHSTASARVKFTTPPFVVL